MSAQFASDLQALQYSNATQRFRQLESFNEASRDSYEPSCAFVITNEHSKGCRISNFQFMLPSDDYTARAYRRNCRSGPMKERFFVKTETECGINRSSQVLLDSGPDGAALVDGYLLNHFRFSGQSPTETQYWIDLRHSLAGFCMQPIPWVCWL